MKVKICDNLVKENLLTENVFTFPGPLGQHSWALEESEGVDSASLQFSVIENDRKEEREMPKDNVPTLNKGKGGSFWKPHTENLDINLQQNSRVDYWTSRCEYFKNECTGHQKLVWLHV